MAVPGLVPFCAQLSTQAVRVMHDAPQDAAATAELMLRTLASLQIPYQQVRSVCG